MIIIELYLYNKTKFVIFLRRKYTKYIQFENNVFEDFTNILGKDDIISKRLMESIKTISDFFYNKDLRFSIDSTKIYKEKFSDNNELVYQVSNDKLKIISCKGTMMINKK